MDNSKKILFAITTFNQSNITRLCLDSLKLITDEYDVIIVDDASTDDTIRLCVEHNIKYITKETGLGLTDSWNKAYQYFKDNGYGYLIIANNDILVPDKALTEMANVLDYWPCSLVVPMSTIKGSGHNVVQAIDNYYGTNEYDNPDNYGMILPSNEIQMQFYIALIIIMAQMNMTIQIIMEWYKNIYLI